MLNFVKKAISWYLNKASQTDVWTPSCTIPLKYFDFKKEGNC